MKTDEQIIEEALKEFADRNNMIEFDRSAIENNQQIENLISKALSLKEQEFQVFLEEISFEGFNHNCNFCILNEARIKDKLRGLKSKIKGDESG